MSEHRLPDYLDHMQQAALLELLKQLPAVCQDADDEDCNDYGMEP